MKIEIEKFESRPQAWKGACDGFFAFFGFCELRLYYSIWSVAAGMFLGAATLLGIVWLAARNIPGS